MGLLDLLDSILDDVIYESAVSQRRVLTDAKIKAHSSENKELKSKIDRKRNETQKLIKEIEKDREK